jgi:hypothetical protein
MTTPKEKGKSLKQLRNAAVSVIASANLRSNWSVEPLPATEAIMVKVNRDALRQLQEALRHYPADCELEDLSRQAAQGAAAQTIHKISPVEPVIDFT